MLGKGLSKQNAGLCSMAPKIFSLLISEQQDMAMAVNVRVIKFTAASSSLVRPHKVCKYLNIDSYELCVLSVLS